MRSVARPFTVTSIGRNAQGERGEEEEGSRMLAERAEVESGWGGSRVSGGSERDFGANLAGGKFVKIDTIDTTALTDRNDRTVTTVGIGCRVWFEKLL